MKRNITVNLFGTLYPIDEDAYALLDNYLQNMRGYFSRQTDGREIADDIEARVAELMSELRSSGVNAINIEHVEEIIRRVGNPEQLDNDFDAADQQENTSQTQESTPTQDAPKSSQTNRRLFRDIRHALLGGVLAGFSVYTGTSTTLLRIIVCIITLFMMFLPDAPVFLIPVALYLICWIAIPAAKTPAERLEMKGAPINMATLQEEFLKTTRNISGSIPANAAHRLARGILTVLKGLAALAVTVLIVTCAIGLVATIGVIILSFSVPEQDFPIIFGNYSLINIIHNSASRLQIWTLATSLMLSLGLTLFLGVRLLMQFAGKANPMGRGWMWGCIIVWLISLGTLTGSWASVIAQSVRYERDMRKERRHSRTSLTPLTDAGWTVSKDRNLNGHYSKTGEHFEGYDQRRYIDGWCKDGDFSYEIIRTVRTAPGRYTLTAAARTDGNGCEIFAINGNRDRYAAPVPNCGNVGGEIWNNARQRLEADSTGTLPDHERLSRIAGANHGRGYGWNTVTVKGITVGSDSTLIYGVTNVSPVTPWDGIWFSATSFDLTQD